MTYWEWDSLSGMDERRKYLEGKLQCHVGVDSADHSLLFCTNPHNHVGQIVAVVEHHAQLFECVTGVLQCLQ